MNNRQFLLNESILRAAKLMNNGFLMEANSNRQRRLGTARKESRAAAKRAKAVSLQQSAEENPDIRRLQNQAKRSEKQAEKAENRFEKDRFIGWAKNNEKDALIIWQNWSDYGYGEEANKAFGEYFIPKLDECQSFPAAYTYAVDLTLKYFIYGGEKYKVEDNDSISDESNETSSQSVTDNTKTETQSNNSAPGASNLGSGQPENAGADNEKTQTSVQQVPASVEETPVEEKAEEIKKTGTQEEKRQAEQAKQNVEKAEKIEHEIKDHIAYGYGQKMINANNREELNKIYEEIKQQQWYQNCNYHMGVKAINQNSTSRDILDKIYRCMSKAFNEIHNASPLDAKYDDEVKSRRELRDKANYYNDNFMEETEDKLQEQKKRKYINKLIKEAIMDELRNKKRLF